MAQLSEALAVITENVKTIVYTFTGRKIFFSTITILILASISFLTLDYFTGYLYFNRLDKKIKVLQQIENKSDENLFKQKVKESYFEILNETNSYHTLKKISIDKDSKTYGIMVRIVISMILPILILFSSVGDQNFRNIFIGVIIFIVLFGFISALIPIISKLWITCIVIIFGELIILIILSKLYKK